MTTPEKTVEEIVEEVIDTLADRVCLLALDTGDVETIEKILTQTLTAERQRCDEMVEAERERIKDLLPELDDNDRYRADKDKIQRGYNMAMDEVYEALTQPNNKKYELQRR